MVSSLYGDKILTLNYPNEPVRDRMNVISAERIYDCMKRHWLPKHRLVFHQVDRAIDKERFVDFSTEEFLLEQPLKVLAHIRVHVVVR